MIIQEKVIEIPKKKKLNRNKNSSTEIWTETQYDEYMAELYGFEYIAGYTDSGVPYGIVKNQENFSKETYEYDDDEIPF